MANSLNMASEPFARDGQAVAQSPVECTGLRPRSAEATRTSVLPLSMRKAGYIAQVGEANPHSPRLEYKITAKEQNEEAERAAERYQVFLLPGICLLVAGAALSRGRFGKGKSARADRA